METSTVHMDLRAPLEYEEAPGLDPFMCPVGEAQTELLFCFELNGEQAGRIDPEADCFLGELVFSGKRNDIQGKVRLSAGLYLFTQQRRTLNREECISAAIEQQQEGLWERAHPENRLYIRRLYEDGSPVTQLFRPCREGGLK
ncbi:MAG: hypothetical protein FWC24_01225 [Treponema sp.]|nr:hypothetical protein [Treponema sp.]